MSNHVIESDRSHNSVTDKEHEVGRWAGLAQKIFLDELYLYVFSVSIKNQAGTLIEKSYCKVTG